jgi:hypothetical protein
MKFTRSWMPKFNNEREAAEFWATHDSTDYIDDMKPVDVELDPALRERIESSAIGYAST